MADNLTDLEEELDATEVDDQPKEEDFQLPETDDDQGGDTEESAPEPEPSKPAAPEISDDLDAVRADAQHHAQQWEAYLASTEQGLVAARKRLEDAHNLGEEVSEVVAAQEALQRAVLEQREAERGAAGARENLAQASRPRAQAAQDWINRNPRYKSDPAFKERASKIAAELQADYRVDSPKMYEELDRRLRTKTPMGAKGARTGGAPTSRQPNRPASDQGAAATGFDSKWMRKLGLDPNNKKHLQEWKKNFNDLAAEA